jgi:hypothetical protein
MAKTNTIDYRDGGLEFAKRIAIHLQSGKLTQAEFDYELNAWNAAQYEAVTQQQIDLSVSRQATAQLRELSKIQNEVIEGQKKIIEGYHQVSEIYGGRKVTVKVDGSEIEKQVDRIQGMKSDAFDNEHMAGNFRNGF